MTDQAEVKAAGGVVRRDDGRICLCHRPRYDDWSLPKGKLDDGESFEQAAVREIEEEVQLRVRLHTELDAAHYRDHNGRQKIVRYWLCTIERDLGFAPNDEVDELRWLTPTEAQALLTYDHDRELLAAL